MSDILLRSLNKVFFFAIITVMSGCIVEPINLDEYVEDPSVVDIIDKGKGAVNITSDSEQGLVPGNSRISGLNPAKYYIVEEWDKTGSFMSIRFVSSNGVRTASLSGIGRVTSGMIIGLTNDNNYRVRAAKPLAGTVNYYDQASPPPPASGGTPKTVSTGALTLNTPANGGLFIDLNPSSTLGSSSFDGVKIGVPALFSNRIISLDSSPSANNYVFIAKDMGGNFMVDSLNLNFYYLAVTVVLAPEPDPSDFEGIKIIVTLGITGDKSPQAGQPIAYSQKPPYAARNIVITNPDVYDSGSFRWYFDGSEILIASGLGTFNFKPDDDIMYLIAGKHIITIEAAVGGIPYSAHIEVTVTQ